MSVLLYHNVGEGDVSGQLEGVGGVGHSAGQDQGCPHVIRPDRHAGQQAVTGCITT